jgi:hypothetical protein
MKQGKIIEGKIMQTLNQWEAPDARVSGKLRERLPSPFSHDFALNDFANPDE